MDGVHDLGGREGFGPIVDKADDKPFHADWEMRAFGMKQASASATSWTIDWFRCCRELTGPVDYLTPALFRPMAHDARRSVDRRGLSHPGRGQGRRLGLHADVQLLRRTLESARAFVKSPRSFAVSWIRRRDSRSPDTVRCRLDGGSGHTRLPGYVRGRVGVVHAHHGGHALADASSRGEQRGEHLYTVRFASADLWPEATGSRDPVLVDLWESYLGPA